MFEHRDGQHKTDAKHNYIKEESDFTRIIHGYTKENNSNSKSDRESAIEGDGSSEIKTKKPLMVTGSISIKGSPGDKQKYSESDSACARKGTTNKASRTNNKPYNGSPRQLSPESPNGERCD